MWKLDHQLEFGKNRFLQTILIGLIAFCIVFTHSEVGSAQDSSQTNNGQQLPNKAINLFNDVDKSYANYIFIQYLAKREIIKGFPDGSFRPLEGLTRAQMASLIAFVEKLDVHKSQIVSAENDFPFPDVPEGHWANGAINAAYQAGIISGFEDGTFRPDEPLTKAQALVLTLKLGSAPFPIVKDYSFDDVPIGHWAKSYINAALEIGLVSKPSSTLFAPDAEFTRGDLSRALGIMMTTAPNLRTVDLPMSLKTKEGVVNIISVDNKAVRKAANVEKIKNGDTIEVLQGSAELVFEDGTGMLLKTGSIIAVKENRGRSYIMKDGEPGISVDWLKLNMSKGVIVGALATNAKLENEKNVGIANIPRTGPANQFVKELHFNDNSGNAVTFLPSQRVVLSETESGSTELPFNAANIADDEWWKVATEQRTRVEVDMPWGIAAIQGTIFSISITDNNTGEVTTLTGSVQVTSSGVSVTVSQGQQTAITSEGVQPAAALTPEAQIQWLEVKEFVVEKVQEIVAKQVDLQAVKPDVPVTPPAVEQPAQQPIQPVVPTQPTQPTMPFPIETTFQNERITAVLQILNQIETSATQASGQPPSTSNQTSGGSSSAPSSVAVASMTVVGEGGVSELLEGESLQMLATVLPENATNKAVAWSVENGTGTATISENGLLTAVSVGTVRVKAVAKDGSGVAENNVITIGTTTNVNFQTDKTYTASLFAFSSSGTFGPTSGDKSRVIGNILITGENVTLRNLIVEGGITIDTDGDATLENVEVIGSQIINIKNVAASSFYAINVVSPGVKITDYDGASIVVSGGSLGKIEIAPDMGTSPIKLSGNFGTSVIEILKPAAIFLGNGVQINKLDVKAALTMEGDESGINTVVGGNNVTRVTGNISGTVKTSGEVPVAGATVEVIAAENSYISTTNINGNFTFNNLPVGNNYIVRANAVGYLDNSISEVTVGAGESTDITLFLSVSYLTFDSSTGTITDYNSDGGTDVVIPSQIGGVTVTSIGEDAFYNKNLTSITIPSSVTSIGSYAFSYNDLTEITIPNNVTTIGDYAFANNSYLSSLTIGSGVQSIGEYAFADCQQLTSVVIPDNVTGLGRGAFYYNTNLANLTIGNGITTISRDAFAVTKIATLVIPNSVTSIDQGAFADSEIVSLSIGAGVTSIGQDAFYSNNIENLAIPNNVTNIGDGAFEFNPLTSLTIGNQITSIGARAFRGTTTTNLTSVIIPDSVINIGSMAFRNTMLANVTIGNSVTIIGEYAFADNNLASLTIPDSVTFIGNWAFKQNVNLTSITIGPNVTSIGGYLIHTGYNYFTNAYLDTETGGAGTYTGTYTGPWTKNSASVLRISQTETIVAENQAVAEIVVIRSGETSEPSTVNYSTTNNTAIAGSDYLSASGTLSFAIGETTKTISIAILPDELTEGNESFNITLSNASNGTIEVGNAKVVIYDSNLDLDIFADGSTYVSAYLKTIEFQPINGKTVIFYLDNNSNKIYDSTLDIELASGVTDSYGYIQMPISLASGVYQVYAYCNELNMQTYSTYVNLGEDLPQEFLGFIEPSYSVNKNEGSATIEIIRTSAELPLTLNYSTVDGTAVTGTHYTGSSGAISFGANEYIKTIQVPLLVSAELEYGKTFSVVLSNPSTGEITDGYDLVQVYIYDNDNDNTLETAALITVGVNPIERIIAPSEDIDWFKFFAEAGKSYTVNLTNPSSLLDSVITLNNSNGDEIEYVDSNNEGSDETLIWTCDNTGYYFIKVTSWDSYSAGYYSLAVVTQSSPPQANPIFRNYSVITGIAEAGALIEASISLWQNESYGDFLIGETIVEQDGNYKLSIDNTFLPLEEEDEITIKATKFPNLQSEPVTIYVQWGSHSISPNNTSLFVDQGSAQINITSMNDAQGNNVLPDFTSDSGSAFTYSMSKGLVNVVVSKEANSTVLSIPNLAQATESGEYKIVITRLSDGQQWRINTSIYLGSAPSNAKELTGTAIGNLVGNPATGVNNIPIGTKVANLKAGLSVSANATVEILSNSGGELVLNQLTTDATSTMVIEVTAQDGTKTEYTISLVNPITITATASPASLTMDSGNKTFMYGEHYFTLTLTSGTVKTGVGINDVTITGLPTGLSYLVGKFGDKINVELQDSADVAVSSPFTLSAVIKGSAVIEAGALDSAPIPIVINPTQELPAIQIAATATDSIVDMASNTVVSTLNDKWVLNVTTGTLKDTFDVSDLTITGLPGLSAMASKDGNSIVITVSGMASPLVDSVINVGIIIKGSGVMESNATDSNVINVTIEPAIIA